MPTPAAAPAARQRRRWPTLVALAAVVAGLAFAALPFAARRLIGPERLKAMTEQALTDALGRQVAIDGEVDIRLAPWFGLTMGPVTVADAPGFGPQPMATAGRLDMTIRMLPLLARVVSPGSVRLHDLAVHLRRDASGRANWQDLAAPRNAAAADAPGWEAAPEPRDIRLENASLDYRDDVTGRTLAVTGLRLKTGHGQPFGFAGSFTARGLVPDASLECHIQGTAALDAQRGRLALHNTRVEAGLAFAGPLAPGGAAPAHVVGRLVVDYDPAGAALRLSDLDVRAPGARLAGAATVSDLPDAPKLRAELDLAADTDGKWREILGLTPAGEPDRLVAAPAVAPPSSSMTAPVLTQAGPPVSGLAQAKFVVAADASEVRLEDFDLRLPQGRVTGTAALRLGDRPGLAASLTAEEVDFTRTPVPAGRGQWPFPAPWLALGDLEARADLRRCTLAGLSLTDAHVTARSGQGLLRLYPVSAVLPGGVVSLDVRLDAGPDGPADSLGLDIRAAVQPSSAPSSRVRLLGRADAAGARGNLVLQSPAPAAALKLLGSRTGLPAAPLEAKGRFSLTPGVGRLAARAELDELEAKLGAAALRGRVVYDASARDQVVFDLAAEGVDVDKLSTLPAPPDTAENNAVRARGRLRLDRLAAGGVEVRDLALELAAAGGRVEGVVDGGELCGGRLTGRIDRNPAGRISAALQLAGADAARLTPRAKAGPGLAGQLTARATVEAVPAAKGAPATIAIAAEAEGSRLALVQGGERRPLAEPKASLTLAAREDADSFDGEATLAVSAAAAPGLGDLRVSIKGPFSLDKSGRLRESAPGRIEASAAIRAKEAGRNVKCSLSGPFSLEGGGGFTAGDLQFDAGGLIGRLKVWRKDGDGAPARFSLETGVLAPRPLLAAWGVPVPAQTPTDKLVRASLAVSGAADAAGLTLDRLAVNLDDSKLTGHAALPGYDLRRGRWELAIDSLDLDAYFPRQPSQGPPSAAERRKRLDYQLLRDLNLEARLSFGWLKKGNVVFDATTILANAKGGLFTFRQESPHFYGGRFFAEIRGDARDVVLKTLVELKLEGFECARFLWDWAEGDTLASGGATFILAARTSGATEEELRGNLAGNASLQVTRGELKVRESDARPGETAKHERIPFDVFSSTWLSRTGVAHTDDFRIEGPRMRVTGRGFVDLRDETINLSLTAALAGGGEVPATIIGPLDGPRLAIDRSKIIGDIVYRVLQGIVSIPGKAVTRILQLR